MVPAYLALRAKGYTVTRETPGNEAQETWIAESDSLRLVAEDTVSLLGLAPMAEQRGSDWKASDDEIEAFLRAYGP